MLFVMEKTEGAKDAGWQALITVYCFIRRGPAGAVPERNNKSQEPTASRQSVPGKTGAYFRPRGPGLQESGYRRECWNTPRDTRYPLFCGGSGAGGNPHRQF